MMHYGAKYAIGHDLLAPFFYYFSSLIRYN